MTEPLKKVPLDYIYNSIRNPKPEIQNLIRRLRIVRDMDTKSYAQLKRELPFLVCGTFNPPFRKNENFAYTEYFFVDIDHIEAKGMVLSQVRMHIQADNRVVMSFLSPSEDGLKVLFKFKERCYDAGVYSLFYKAFVKQFSQQYGLEQVLDAKTCDVSRACFISMDSEAYFNPNAEPVDWNQYMAMDNPQELFTQKHSLERELKESVKQQKEEERVMKDVDPDAAEILKIKELLKLRKTPKERAEVYVPEQLNEVIADVKKAIEETGMQVTEILNINYGKKIRMKLGHRLAEVNLFYGKRGFSVVKSPRTGTNAELNDLCVDVINGYIMQL
ncbi:MAG: CRISPR-associated primase-polymerase type B [Bacteroidales bacterium]|nr:CRISPR-associated primase-polymerase type B [Bacteroidales bacterium]